MLSILQNRPFMYSLIGLFCLVFSVLFTLSIFSARYVIGIFIRILQVSGFKRSFRLY